MTVLPGEVCHIVIVDDHARLRRALRTLTESNQRFRVVGEADNSLAALQIVGSANPDIAILDISLNDPIDGLTLTVHLKSRHPHLKVLLLSLHTNAEFVHKGRSAGASGFLSKSEAAEKLVEALEVVANGDFYGFSPL